MAVLNVTTSLATPKSTSQGTASGPLASLSQDPYAVNQLRYPLAGIGTTDVPSHVVFYINVPTSSKYITKNPGSTVPVQSASQQNYDTLKSQGGVYQPLKNQANVASGVGESFLVDFLTKGLGKAAGNIIGNAAGSEVAETLDLKPQLTRINTSIAIYMPDTVITSYDQDWGTVSATEAYGDVGRAAALGGSDGGLGSAWDVIKTTFNNIVGTDDGQPQKYNKPATAEIAGRIAEKSGVVNSGFTDLYLKSQGQAVNPHTEMIFKGVSNRKFNLTFDLIPRSQIESIEIYNIIKTFKAFSAPEVTPTNGGRYFIPPAQFDIKFYFQNIENPALNRISTCVLTSFNVNYNGSNGIWTTFNDGSPLHIQLQMSFVETDILTRELIENFGY